MAEADRSLGFGVCSDMPAQFAGYSLTTSRAKSEPKTMKQAIRTKIEHCAIRVKHSALYSWPDTDDISAPRLLAGFKGRRNALWSMGAGRARSSARVQG